MILAATEAPPPGVIVAVLAIIVLIYAWGIRWLWRWFKTPKDVRRRISREARDRSTRLGSQLGRSQGGTLVLAVLSAVNMDEIYFFAKGWRAYKRGEIGRNAPDA